MSLKIICLVACIIPRLVFSTNQSVGFSDHFTCTPRCPVLKSSNKMLSLWIILFLFYFGSSFTTSFGSYFSVVIGTCSSKTCQFESKKLTSDTRDYQCKRVNLPYSPNAQSLIPFNIFSVCYQGFARMLLTRSVDPSDFLETSWDHMAGNSAKSRTVMFWFSRVDL